MRILVTLMLLFGFGILNAQIIEEAKNICNKNVQAGSVLASNDSLDGLKTGLWVHYYDKKGWETEDLKVADSFMLVTYQEDAPVGICVICDFEANLLGVESYLQDSTWVEHGKFLWINKDGVLSAEENYSIGLLHGSKDEYYVTGQVQSKFVYRNDTVVSAEIYELDGNLQKSYVCTYMEDTTIIQSYQYTKDGILLNSERTLNGIKDGENNVYYKNGTKRIAGIDEMGVRVKETHFDEDGHRTKQVTCSAVSQQCTVIKYDKNDKIKKEYPATFNGYGAVIYK